MESVESSSLSYSQESMPDSDTALFEEKEKSLALKPKLKRKEKRVGLVDDERCEYHFQEPDHQESPDRVRVIRDKLKSTGLYPKLVKLVTIEPTKDDLLLVHTNRYVNKVMRTCKNYRHAMIDSPDVWVNGEDSLISAVTAVGGVLSAVDAVVSGRVDKVFCNIRPPGHHASSHKASGFCIFNNVAIGIKKALTYSGINKVLIFDWDLHHGDGTESVFKCNKNVMFTSFHRGPPFWPGSGHSGISGRHRTVRNYPQTVEEGTDKYMKNFYQSFLPAAREFNPDLIFISCGFDGHKDDLYEALPLDYDDFRILTKEMCNLANNCCDGRLISVLEGGYSLDVLKDCAAIHVNELLVNN